MVNEINVLKWAANNIGTIPLPLVTTCSGARADSGCVIVSTLF